MAKAKKLLEHLLNNPKDFTFGELETLLTGFIINELRQGGYLND